MKQVYMRRSTDSASRPPRRSTLQALRSMLGLVPVTESLRHLSHWRRRPEASSASAGK
ncbi:MAG TPA: hypothetical protein VGC13_33040 [Longimicrobium sp.]|jgi:hypothetical protein|uniref:hypothetical protein n=1 Tax=Longimicrobium sp. TaxID=2029185 RepID=UPI002EDAD9C1